MSISGTRFAQSIGSHHLNLVGASDIASNFKIRILGDYKLVCHIFVFCRKLYAHTSVTYEFVIAQNDYFEVVAMSDALTKCKARSRVATDELSKFCT